MKALLSISVTVGGQAVWALAQAAIIVVLSSRGEHTLIGVYVLGLAIFAPLCLFGSLNLRTTVALGSGASLVSARLALLLRALVVAISLLATFAALATAAPTLRIWGAAALLVGVRAVDQVSDVLTGFYQREDRQDLIARSFFARGAANIFPFLTVALWTGNYLAANAVTLVTTLGVAVWYDVLPTLRREEIAESASSLSSRLWNVAKHSLSIAAYPPLDSLHFNSFRYALFLGTSPDFMGLVGVAQTLFVPFQLLASAVGFRFLPQARRASEEVNQTKLINHALTGVGCGFAITLAFLAFVWIAPAPLVAILFGDRATDARPVMILVAIAMLPVTATGFAGISLVAYGNRRMYALAPAVAIAFFWVCAIGVYALGGAKATGHLLSTEVSITMIFLGSATLRLGLALVSIFKEFHARQLER